MSEKRIRLRGHADVRVSVKDMNDEAENCPNCGSKKVWFISGYFCPECSKERYNEGY